MKLLSDSRRRRKFIIWLRGWGRAGRRGRAAQRARRRRRRGAEAAEAAEAAQAQSATREPSSSRGGLGQAGGAAAVILEPKKIKSVIVSIVSPSICLEVMGPDAMRS